MATQNLKYTITPKGIMFYYALLFTNIGLLLLKKVSALNIGYAFIFSHITNFSITSILMSVICFIWLMQGAAFKLIIWLAVVATLLNFIIEIFVTFLNTPDIIDAYYGTAGAIFTVLVMLLIQRTALIATVN